MGLCYFREGKEHQGNAGAKNGKKVSAGAVGGAQEGDVRRETNLQEGLEPEKVSCLMMREAARGHLRAVCEGQ